MSTSNFLSSHSLRVGRHLREDPEDKVSLFVWLEGGRDDDVFSLRQPKPRADLPKIDEGLRASAGGMGEEKLPLQVDTGPANELRLQLELRHNAEQFDAQTLVWS